MLKRVGWILLAALVEGCGGAPPPAEPRAGAMATWDGGAISLPELESALAATRIPVCRRARRAGRLEQLVRCYRELAEGHALEGLVLAEVEDVDQALKDLGGGDEDYLTLRRRVYFEVFLRRLRDSIEVEDADIEAHFRSDPERYRTPAQLNLSNIFRRHGDPARPEETDELLRSLKARFEAGETFAALAREYSHSETRLRDGEVGQVSENDLAPRLRRIAFALDDGEVSDPVRVKGGSVLLYVQGVSDGAEPSLTQARGPIRQELGTQRIEQKISEQVAGHEPPAGSLLLSLDDLVAALDSGDPETVVLEIEGDRLSVGEFRRLARLDARATVADLDAEGRDQLSELYRRQREHRLLAIDLLDAADPEVREEAEQRLRRVAVSRLVDERIEQQMGRRVDAQADTLRGYFEDNRHHYQSPLRFKLRKWNLPFDDHPPAQLRRMEELRERLVAGELDLPAAVAELGGRVEDIGWREFDSLADEIPGKARSYLMAVGDSGWSVCYQQDGAIHLIRLDEREEPVPLEYQEAVELVRRDYLDRFQQDLYRRIVEERLSAAGFVFDEDAVRRALAPEDSAPQREGAESNPS